MFFFSFFGVGLGAVLVVHIFDGFPDKKLVRRDLKFFAKFANGGTVKRSSICRFFISFESAKIRPHRLPFSAVEEGHSSEKQDGGRGIRRNRGRENLPFERRIQDGVRSTSGGGRERARAPPKTFAADCRRSTGTILKCYISN